MNINSAIYELSLVLSSANSTPFHSLPIQLSQNGKYCLYNNEDIGTESQSRLNMPLISLIRPQLIIGTYMVREALISTATGLSAVESVTFVQEQEKTLSLVSLKVRNLALVNRSLDCPQAFAFITHT